MSMLNIHIRWKIAKTIKTASLFFNLKHAYLAYTFSKFIDRIKEELCPNLVDY